MQHTSSLTDTQKLMQLMIEMQQEDEEPVKIVESEKELPQSAKKLENANDVTADQTMVGSKRTVKFMSLSKNDTVETSEIAKEESSSEDPNSEMISADDLMACMT